MDNPQRPARRRRPDEGRRVVRYATYEHEGRRQVGELRGRMLVPLRGAAELGTIRNLVRAQAPLGGGAR